jgi:hypothetical protein
MKSKTIKDEGQTLSVPDEKLPPVVELSHSQAKKLVKREMTEKQKEHVQKMIEANKIKWEAKKKEKEQVAKKAQDEKEEKETVIIVKPKRIYPPRKKAPKNIKPYKDQETDAEEEETADESDDEYQITKTTKKIEMKAKALEKIDATLQKIAPTNKYLELLKAKSRW